jgi:hypothetical protein
MRLTLTGVIVVLVAAGAAACGGSNAPEAGGSPGTPTPTASATAPVVVTGSGPCSLVTQDEAAQVVGSPVPPSTERSVSFPVNGASIKEQVCLFGSDVLIARFALGSAASDLFHQDRDSLASASDFEQVSGVGDEAFFAKGQLALRLGDTGLIVDVGQNTGQTSDEQEKEKALAAIALGRL